MMKKQNLWFLTLFSLILVLSVYYITMPSSLFATNNGKDNNKKVVIEESEILTALRIDCEDERSAMRDEFRMVLTNIEASVEEKNNAYEQLKLLDIIKGQEEELEAIIKDKYKLSAFVKIDGNQIRVVVASNKHDTELANNIMRSIQDNFDEKMYISVKFQS